MEDIHLPRPQPKIRLLRINEVESDGESISCTVRHRRADDRYVCLSYCWGDDEPEHSITVNGKRHPVRQNLFKFLHTARRYKFDVLLWIDAISINQEDDHEKAIHIPAMATIFSEAEFVVVWLGLGDEDLHLLARMHDVAAFNDGQVPNLSARVEDDPSAEQTVYRRYSQEWHDTFDLKGNGRLKFKPWLNILGPVSFTAPKAYEPCSDQGEWLFSMYGHQLLRLACLNGYWRRAWICQELSMARHAWLLTPPASNPIEVRVLLELLSCHVWAMNQKREPLVDNDAHTEESLRTLRDVVGERSRCDLGRMLAMTSKMQCRFKRDRLFSVLSMAEEGKSFMATYAESDEMLMINAIGVAFTQHVEKFLSRPSTLAPGVDPLSIMVFPFRDNAIVGRLFQCLEMARPCTAGQQIMINTLVPCSTPLEDTTYYWIYDKSHTEMASDFCVQLFCQERFFLMRYTQRKESLASTIFDPRLANVWVSGGSIWRSIFKVGSLSPRFLGSRYNPPRTLCRGFGP